MNERKRRAGWADSDLLRRNFRISEPDHSIENLSRDKPDASLRPIIIAYYDETPKGGRNENPDASYIWCCHCQKETHWRGYVVEDDTEFRFTIGNDCGEKHYGASFDIIVKEFREREARQIVLRSFERLKPQIDGIREDIETINGWKWIHSFHDFSSTLRKKAPNAFNALSRAQKRGNLHATRNVRDLEAERRRDERYREAYIHFRSLPYSERKQLQEAGLQPEKDDSEIYISESVNFGPLSGGSLFGSCDPRGSLLRTRKALENFVDMANEDTNSFTTREIGNVRKELVDSIRELKASIDTSSQATRFFNISHLENLKSWSRHHRLFEIWSDQGRYFVRDTPSGYTPSSTSLELVPFEIEIEVVTPNIDRMIGDLEPTTLRPSL